MCSQNVDISSDLNSLATVGLNLKILSENIDQIGAGQIKNLTLDTRQILMLDLPSTDDEASSPDGRSLVSTYTNGKIQIWGVE